MLPKISQATTAKTRNHWKLILSQSQRVVSEHANSRVKKFQIWGGEFRNRLKHYDVMTEIVCGLLNFHISGTITV
jgi:hypothetical protein